MKTNYAKANPIGLNELQILHVAVKMSEVLDIQLEKQSFNYISIFSSDS